MSHDTILFVVIAGALIGWMLWQRRGDTTSAQAHALVEQGARLVDVRSPAEFASGHLAGALNIPLGELSGRTRDIGGATTPVVVYCQSGARSRAAAAILRRAGFTRVYNLGSISRW